MMTMTIRNVTNSHNSCGKGWIEIMLSFVMANLILFGLMSVVAGGVYAQGVDKKTPQRNEPPGTVAIDKAVYEQLLLTADALIKNGKPGDAYTLLEPLEFENSGDERFDYLIGIAALDSGKADKATFAFERVLAVNPNSVARLEMARAYYQLGDILRAKTEFMTVLQQNPPQAARANIEKYLDEIAAQESGNRARITGYVEGAAGNDNNVNNATSQSQIQAFVPALTTVTLDPANVKTSDNYYGVTIGGEMTYKLNNNFGWYAGADMRQRSYSTQKSFDSLDMGGRAGVAFDAKANHFRIVISGEQYKLMGSFKSDTTGVNAEWRHVFSPSNQSKLFGQYTQYRFADVTMQPNDCDQQAVGVGWLHASADGKSTLSGSLYYGIEKDVSTIVTSVSTPISYVGRADGGKRFGGLRAGWQITYSERTTLFANAGMQVGNYASTNPYFQQQRKDRLYDLTAGANWRWSKLWTLRPQLSYSQNDSNIVIYGYNRIDVSLNIRRDFR